MVRDPSSAQRARVVADGTDQNECISSTVQKSSRAQFQGCVSSPAPLIKRRRWGGEAVSASDRGGRICRAPVQTGKKERMKESHSEGVANHAGPESCVAHREVGREALTGESAGWVLSREILFNLGCRRRDKMRKATPEWPLCEDMPDPTRSETPCTRGHFLRGNREISQPTTGVPAVRIGNPKGARR